VEAVFFVGGSVDALAVASSDDLDLALHVPLAAETLTLTDPSPLVGLGEILGADRRVGPLRDATCRSFPVWDLGSEIAQRLAALDDAMIDLVAARWHAKHASSLDADLYELSTCLADLRDAIRRADAGHRVFVLLEERAF
jgi:hypothetical protein